MKFSRYSFLLLSMLSSASASTLTLDSAMERFIQNSYDLQIARQESQKSRADLITAKEHPNPTVYTAYEFMDVQHHFGSNARGSDGQVTVMATHTIETAGKRDRRIDVANNAIVLGDLLYDETLREKLSDLINLYYALLGDQINLANAQENVAAYEKILSVAKAKLDNGFLSAIDYQKLSLQKIDYLKEIENSHLALIQDQENLAALLALPSSDLTVAETADAGITLPDLETMLSKAESRPDCKAALQNRSVAEASLKLENAIAIPNVSVGLEYAAFAPYYEPLAGVNATIPIPIFDKNAGDIQKARINVLQSKNLYDKTLRMAQADIAQNYATLKSRLNLYQTMKEGFANAKELKEKQEKIFALKGISALELLDAQKSYREFQKTFTQSAINVQIADLQLKLSTATPLTTSKGN